jgi:hypothetical protein
VTRLVLSTLKHRRCEQHCVGLGNQLSGWPAKSRNERTHSPCANHPLCTLSSVDNHRAGRLKSGKDARKYGIRLRLSGRFVAYSVLRGRFRYIARSPDSVIMPHLSVGLVDLVAQMLECKQCPFSTIV